MFSFPLTGHWKLNWKQNSPWEQVENIKGVGLDFREKPLQDVTVMRIRRHDIEIWTALSEFGTYRLCEQRRFRRACACAQSRQNLRCSLIQAVSHEEPSDRKPDPWLLWMAGHAQLKSVMTECSKTQIRLTELELSFTRNTKILVPLLCNPKTNVGINSKVKLKIFRIKFALKQIRTCNLLKRNQVNAKILSWMNSKWSENIRNIMHMFQMINLWHS